MVKLGAAAREDDLFELSSQDFLLGLFDQFDQAKNKHGAYAVLHGALGIVSEKPVRAFGIFQAFQLGGLLGEALPLEPSARNDNASDEGACFVQYLGGKGRAGVYAYGREFPETVKQISVGGPVGSRRHAFHGYRVGKLKGDLLPGQLHNVKLRIELFQSSLQLSASFGNDGSEDAAVYFFP